MSVSRVAIAGVLALLSPTPGACAASGLAPIGAGLRGPPGVQARVWARGPAHAAAFAFDGQGRLWIAAAGLSGHAGDGVYLVARPGARPVEVVGGLVDPLGLIWDEDTLFVSS